MFFECINSLKLAVIFNKKNFIIKNNKKNFSLLKIFLKLNLIKSIENKENYFIVRVNYINNKPVFKNINNLFKPSHKIFITLNTLKKINKKKNWIFILSTNKGLLTNYNSERKGVGGILLMKLWN